MRYIISLVCASLVGLPVARAEVPLVVTDIPPVHSLVARVMGDLGSPVLLTDRGGSAHDFQLRPSQAAALADAGLVVWIGPEMTPWLDRLLDGMAGDGARLQLLDVAGTATRQFGTGAGHDDAEDGHDHGGTDPHAWLDPGNAGVWLAAIAAELSRIDPDNAATYQANGVAAAAGIVRLDSTLAVQLAPVRGKPFVVFHDAVGYFADHYGLTVAGSVALGDAAMPGAARLKQLQSQLATGGAVCIFPETNHDPKLVTAMAEGTNARIGGALDPEGAQVEPGPDAYAAILTGLVDTLVDCLGTSG